MVTSLSLSLLLSLFLLRISSFFSPPSSIPFFLSFPISLSIPLPLSSFFPPLSLFLSSLFLSLFLLRIHLVHMPHRVPRTHEPQLPNIPSVNYAFLLIWLPEHTHHSAECTFSSF